MHQHFSMFRPRHARGRVRNIGLIALVAMAVVPFSAGAAQAAVVSMHVAIQNQAHHASLKRWSFGTSGGLWANGNSQVPPSVIAHQSTGSFTAESNGFATGTAGFAVYDVIADNGANLGWMRVDFNNPFIGSNTLSCRTSNDNDLFCTPPVQHPSGYQASGTVRFGVIG